MTTPSTLRTRRSVITAAAATGGALATQALAGPLPVAAADVVLGAVNNATSVTTIRSTEVSTSAKAFVGLVANSGVGASTAGVQGQSNSTNGNGVFGVAMAGNSKGVWGRSANGRGVYGEATGTTGLNYGVYGESKSIDGRGVQGVGVIGVSGNGSSWGVFGSGAAVGVRGTGYYGVVGVSNNFGVYGSSA